jgi:hypothetical protein
VKKIKFQICVTAHDPASVRIPEEAANLVPVSVQKIFFEISFGSASGIFGKLKKVEFTKKKSENSDP